MSNSIQYSPIQQMPTQTRQSPVIGDPINKLPSDSTVPSHNEIQIVNSLFKEKKNIMTRILSGMKEVLVIGILFVIFSLPFIDQIIKKFIKLAESEYILIGIKAVLFMLTFFLIDNFYLSRQ